MTATYEQARAEMYALVQATADIVAPGIRIEWQGKKNADNKAPSQTEEWLGVSLKHDPSGQHQASLSCAYGKIRWRRNGSLFVQCFAPLSSGGEKRAMALACAFRGAVELSRGTASGVWFRQPSASEVGPDKNWFNALASARFTYDEVN